MKNPTCEREFNFALVIDGVPRLTDEAIDALFKAGCDDATFAMRGGQLFAEFSRSSTSFNDAVASAIDDIHSARVGAVAIVCP